MTSNEPPQSQSQPTSPKEEPELEPITPPANGTNAFYNSNFYQLPNFDLSKNRFAKSLKYQSPTLPDRECCSPSFFLDFANAQTILSPLTESVPSQVGSTYTEKHLDFARNHEERGPISSFDTNLTGIETSNDRKISSPDEDSLIVCKDEILEEDKPKEDEEKAVAQPRRSRGRKKKEMEAEKEKEASVKEIKDEKIIEARKTRARSKNLNKLGEEAKLDTDKPDEAVQVLDALIEKLHKKVSQQQSEQVKQEMMAEERPAEYGIQISADNFMFDSDTEEKKELLTEEESLRVLRETYQQRKPSVHFLSRLQDSQRITETVLIDGTGLRQNGGKGLKFFRVDERTSGRILSLPEHLDELPLSISKKISKLSNKESYQCKYCGKYFQKGCALGGHISRLHKGESLNFRMRQETRKKRVADRTRGKFLRKESIKQLENRDEL